MKNHLIIHGHFYQPPREEPWSGLIPYQKSAAPFHDWNKRITKECYAANAYSRILNGFGSIRDIVNNYENLSFNFGPTLLNWLKDAAPNIYKRIQDADRISMEKYHGHGNAVAQVYNHTITPLDSIENARTQIRWGIKDFEKHFQRKPEGIWLAETAINEKIIDILVDEGIKYTILSPWQAEAVAKEGSKEFIPLHDQPIDSTKAYKILRPQGELSLFFYNQNLAQGISFQHYLTNADNLYSAVKHYHNPSNSSHLINVATDGEIYGHHEAFGDMCLASFSKLVEDRDDFTFSNYGYYLEQYPPNEIVKLRAGEEGLGSSWSCHHGVSRWYKDCGCSTGSQEGWNQQWRTPLRDAFNNLSKSLSQIYQREMLKLSSDDPLQIKLNYIDVLTGKSSQQDFAKKYIDKANLNDQTRHRFYTLLEGQKFSMFTFTSCGWFFAELSGIEPVQNIKYALKAIELYNEFNEKSLLEQLLSDLEPAKSNIDQRSGKDIALSLTEFTKMDLKQPACIFIFNNLFDINESETNFGNYSLVKLNEKTQTGSVEATGSIIIKDTSIELQKEYEYKLSVDTINSYAVSMKEVGKNEDFSLVPLDAMPYEIKMEIAEALMLSVQNNCQIDLEHAFGELMRVLNYCNNLDIQVTEELKEFSQMVLDKKILGILSPKSKRPNNDEMDEMKEIGVLARDLDIPLASEKIVNTISYKLNKHIDDTLPFDNREDMEYFIYFLEKARESGFTPDLTISQNKVFSFLREHKENLLDGIKEEDFRSFKRMKNLIKISTYIGIEVEEIKHRTLFS